MKRLIDQWEVVQTSIHWNSDDRPADPLHTNRDKQEIHVSHDQYFVPVIYMDNTYS